MKHRDVDTMQQLTLGHGSRNIKQYLLNILSFSDLMYILCFKIYGKLKIDEQVPHEVLTSKKQATYQHFNTLKAHLQDMKN